jgi:hypothetical protein
MIAYNQLCKGSGVPTVEKTGNSSGSLATDSKKSSGTVDKGKQVGVAVIGALVGAALVL